MRHSRNKLSVNRVKALGKGAHGDGGGLWLIKDHSQGGRWVYRFRLHGRNRSMGLGSIRKITLADARKRRNECEALLSEGVDPQAERERRKRAASHSLKTFAEVAESAFESKRAEIKGEGNEKRWFGPLKLHVLSKVGQRSILDITQIDLREVLAPLWHTKADTARKALNRINIIYKHASALGLEVDTFIPAKTKELLGKSRHKPARISAMPHEEVSQFFGSIDEETPTKLALKFLILNPGPRSKPIRFLRWEHIKGDIWNVPGDLMKGARDITPDWSTPLSQQSLELLSTIRKTSMGPYLFPNIRGKGVISDASMSKLMKERDLPYRPHGFRASFRTWASETGKHRDIAELCLAHKIHGAVEAAYIRTDFLEARRQLMQEWSDYVFPIKA